MADAPKVFDCEQPAGDHKKILQPLVSTDLLSADVQVVREGGANTLHYHTGQDGLFVVLDGAARFYRSEDEVLAELDELEGILIPHGTEYWFESADGEPMHLLHVAALSETIDDERVTVVAGESSTTHVDEERGQEV
ncbi:MAG: cupin domain-containing protein [Haloferacaceae archaeon]